VVRSHARLLLNIPPNVTMQRRVKEIHFVGLLALRRLNRSALYANLKADK
jgi:hypothetical protein